MKRRFVLLPTAVFLCVMFVASYDCTAVFAQDEVKEELQFVSSEAFKSKDGKFFHVKGAVRNVSENRAAKKIEVTVILYDKENKDLEKKTVPLTPAVLKPGEEGTFEVITKYNDKIHGYQKTVRWKVRKW
jgi:hypothetical protein